MAADGAEWRAKAEALERELAEQQATFDEFQESSRELEKELEAELHKAEAKVKELTDANHRLQRDLLILQEKFQAAREANTGTVVALENELGRLRARDEEARTRMRQLEQANDDLERSERAAAMSAAEFEAKHNRLLERNVLLEEQLESRAETDAELQRTKDELRDVLLELDVLRQRLLTKDTSAMAVDAPAKGGDAAMVMTPPRPRAALAFAGGPSTPESRIALRTAGRDAALTASPVVIVQDMLARVKALEQRLASCRIMVTPEGPSAPLSGNL